MKSATIHCRELALPPQATLPNFCRLPHVRKVEYSRGNGETMQQLLCRQLALRDAFVVVGLMQVRLMQVCLIQFLEPALQGEFP
jgi:hypothetical protein